MAGKLKGGHRGKRPDLLRYQSSLSGLAHHLRRLKLSYSSPSGRLRGLEFLDVVSQPLSGLRLVQAPVDKSGPCSRLGTHP